MCRKMEEVSLPSTDLTKIQHHIMKQVKLCFELDKTELEISLLVVLTWANHINTLNPESSF